MVYYQATRTLAACSNLIGKLEWQLGLHLNFRIRLQTYAAVSEFREERSVYFPATVLTRLVDTETYHLLPAVCLDMRELVFKACTVSVWEKVRPGQCEWFGRSNHLGVQWKV